MTRKFTKLMAALALLTFLAVPMGMWGQTTTLVSGSGSSGYSIPDGWTVSGTVEGGSYLKFDNGTITSPEFAPHNGLSFTYTVATFGSGDNHPLTIRILNASTNAVIVEKTTATPTSNSYISTDSPLSLGDVAVAFKIQMYAPTEKGVRLRNYSVTGTPASSGPTYTITAQSNNPNYGTVSLSGTTITATPANGYRVSTTSPYTVLPEGSATISQNGNQFTVTPSANTTVTINFEAIPTSNVTLPENDIYGTYTMNVTNPVAYGTTVTLTYTPATDYENYVAAWSVNDEAIAGNTFSMPDEDAVVTVTVAQGVTWNLTIASYDENPTQNLIQWSSDYATMKNEKNGNNTAVNNYIPPTNTSTRFYKNNKFSLIPATDYVITSAVFSATTEGYATAFAGSTWTNATATANGTIVTITPTNGAQTISAIIGGPCGFTSATVYYSEWAYYAITVDEEIENGSVSVNDNLTQAHEDALVSLTATPASGYAWQSWNVYKTGDSQTTVSVTNDQFTMPAYPVTVSATFRPLNTFTVSYFVNGDVVSTEQVTEGNNANLPISPAGVPSGFTFAGWSTSEASTTIIASYAPEDNASLYAVFSKELPVTYSFTMVPDDFSTSGYENNKVHTVSAVAQQSGETITVSYTANNVMRNNDNQILSIQWRKSPSGVISGSISNAVITKVVVNETTNGYLTTTVTNENNVGSFSINNNGGGTGKASEVTVTFTKNSATYYTRVFTKEIAKDTWHFIASPVGTAPVNMSDLTDLYFYDEAAHYWRNKEVSANADGFDFALGKGYLAAYHVEENPEDQITLTFAGTSVCTDDSKAVDVTYNGTIGEETNPLAGWNLVGNPYPHAAYLNQSFYTVAYDTENSKWVVQASTAGTVAACTGAMVKVDSGVTSVLFSKNAPSAPSNGSVKITMGQQVMNRDGVSSTTIDNAIVSFNEGNELPKFYFMEQNANLYIPQGEKEYAIVSAEAQGELPLNFRANEDGQYTLTVNPEGVEMNYLHLIDNMTGNDVDLLATPSYSFNAKTTDYESRFRLVFAANNESGVSASSTTFAFYSNGNWMVNNEGEATLQVIDVMGRVLSNQIISGTAELSLNQQPGVYVLRLVNGNDVKTQKIVVR